MIAPPPLVAGHAASRSHCFEAAGQRWAIGLEWETAQDTVAARTQANARARQTGARYIAYRSPPQPQAGVVSPGFEPVPGAVSAAVAVVDARQRETSSAIDMIGAYELPGGGYWLLAIRLDEIIPGGDQYYADEAGARAAFDELAYRLEQSNRSIPLYAPARWDVTGSHVSNIASELAGARGAPLSLRKDWRAYRLHGVVALIAVVAAVLIYIDYQHQLAEEEAAARAAAVEQPTKIAEPARPWNQEPSPSAAIENCYQTFIAAYQPVAGWSIDDLICVPGKTVRAIYTAKDGGVLRSLDPLLDTEDRSLTTDGRRVTVNYANPSASPRAAQTELLAQSVWHDSLVRALQHEAATLSVAAAGAGQRQQAGALSGAEIVISAPTNPRRWAHILDQVPGLVVSTISVAPTSWTYRIVGTVYDARYYSAWADQQKSGASNASR